jgi:hypothetical protein
MAWELALDLGLEPLLGFVVLAGGTVAIATGNEELLRLSTALALIERNPAGLGATSDHSVDDFTMSLGHRVGVVLEILGGEGGKDFTNGGHDRVPP